MSWLRLGLVAVVFAGQAAAAFHLRPWLVRQGISTRLTAQIAALLALSEGLLSLTFKLLGLEMEHDGTPMWGWVCLSSVGVGVWAGSRARRVPHAELAAAGLVALEVAGLSAAWLGHGEGLASAPLRALLVAPAALGLCSYFGASLGYLLLASREVQPEPRRRGLLGYEALIGRRFLLSKVSPVLSTVTTISLTGVSLGVWLVLVSLGILAGFESDLQHKIIGANAHVVLQQDGHKPFVLAPTLVADVQRVSGVVATAPFVEGEVAIASYSNYTGALLFGVDALQSPKVLGVLGQLHEGSLEPLLEEGERPAARGATLPGDFAAPASLANIVMGVEMAKGLNVKVGDRVRMISPHLEVLTPIGPAPKSLGFRVAAIFSSKMYEYDARYVYVSLAAARRFLELPADVVSGLQLRCDDPDRTGRVGLAAVQAARQPGFVAMDWRQRNQTLFSALKLEKVVAFVVLVFIILVASFSIVNTLTMSVIEKRREIAILKTMGARDVGIMKVFLVQGLLVGAFGTMIGSAAAVGTMKLLERFGFWIPGDVYYIDSLPVKLEAADVVLVVLAALLIVWDFAVFPALRGSLLEPVEGLRDG